MPGELYPVLSQYGHTWEARTPAGKVRARSSAVLNLLRTRFPATLVFAVAGWGPELSVDVGKTREGSGARTIAGGDGRNTGEDVCPTRFRLRYFRIQAARCAGSR